MKDMNKFVMNHSIPVFILMLIFICIVIWTLLIGDRQIALKNIEANINGGLNRTVILYDYAGKPIRTWKGKINLARSDNEISMIVNEEHRIIIHGGIVVVEEHK